MVRRLRQKVNISYHLAFDSRKFLHSVATAGQFLQNWKGLLRRVRPRAAYLKTTHCTFVPLFASVFTDLNCVHKIKINPSKMS